MLGSIWTFITNCFRLHPHVKSHMDCSCSNDSTSSEERTPERRPWLQKHRPREDDSEHESKTSALYKNEGAGAFLRHRLYR